MRSNWIISPSQSVQLTPFFRTIVIVEIVMYTVAPIGANAAGLEGGALARDFINVAE